MHWTEWTGSVETDGRCSAARGRLRVLVAEDSRLVAEALMFSLDTDPRLEAIGYALDGSEALDYMATLEPDVVVVGTRLTGLAPLELIRLTREFYPSVLVIMLCDRLVPAAVEAAYAIGVADCVPVARSVDELLHSISEARIRQQVFERGRRQAARRSMLTLVRPGELDARS